jgi:hypothetical protein
MNFFEKKKDFLVGHPERSSARSASIGLLRMTAIIAFSLLSFGAPVYSQSHDTGPLARDLASDLRLHFHKGELHRVVTTEILRLTFHFPQVDEHDARPSIRTSVYSFTERVDSVLPNGSAIIAASLDSFKTGIDLGEGKHAENFFRFNSAGDWDLTHELHDIKVLPRAQFLGQTIRFVMRPDGTIAEFLNLQDFYQAAIGHGYDYELVHAMLSLSDSLRMGQLLEYGFGGIAAAQGHGTYTSPSTTTEIPATRTVSARRTRSETLDLHVRYSDPPARIEYLEGIAMPLGILDYHASGSGSVTLAKGYLLHSEFQDTAKVLLHVDIDTVPEDITRSVITDVYPIALLHGKFSIKEISRHSGVNQDSLENSMRRASPGSPNQGNGTITNPGNPEPPPVKDNSESH